MFSLDIDMRNEFNTLLKDYGKTVLYRRKSRYVQCKCYNTLHRSGDPSCVVCHGAGKMVSFEKHIIIDQGDTDSVTSTAVGRVDQSSRTVWFKHDSQPNVGDTFYKVGWRGEYPVSLHAVYNVEAVNEVNGDHGRIEYYEVTIVKRPDLVEESKNILTKITGREIEVR